jgi:hypothetical protein
VLREIDCELTDTQSREGKKLHLPYVLIQPPLRMAIRELPKKELKEYFKWFLEVIPGRTAELGKAVQETPGFEAWEPDLTPESLEPLGKWFEGQVERRPRTPEEIEKIEQKIKAGLGSKPMPIVVSDKELTYRTLSLAMDVGMYFCQVLQKNVPGLRWEQPLGSKNFIDYGQPVLMGFKSSLAPFNGPRMIQGLAYGIAGQKVYDVLNAETARRIRDIYDRWSSDERIVAAHSDVLKRALERSRSKRRRS